VEAKVILKNYNNELIIYHIDLILTEEKVNSDNKIFNQFSTFQ